MAGVMASAWETVGVAATVTDLAQGGAEDLVGVVIAALHSEACQNGAADPHGVIAVHGLRVVHGAIAVLAGVAAHAGVAAALAGAAVVHAGATEVPVPALDSVATIMMDPMATAPDEATFQVGETGRYRLRLLQQIRQLLKHQLLQQQTPSKLV